jgi:hypothetical protein
LRDVVELETWKPSFEVGYLSNFLGHCLRVNEFGNELLHFIHVGLCVEPNWGEMVWSEHFKLKLFVSVSSDHLTFWYKIGEGVNCLFKLWLVGSFEVLEDGTVVESDEVWDARNLEVGWSVSDDGSVHRGEDEIWVLVGFGQAFEDWLDSHAGWACWAPEVDEEARTFLDELLEMGQASYLADFSDLGVSSSWIRWWRCSSNSELRHKTLKRGWVHSSCHVCNVWRKSCW